MKKFFTRLTGIALLCMTINAGAQVNRCATNEHEAELRKKNPKREAQIRNYEQSLQSTIQNLSANKTQGVITIPVVVHVLYSTPAQNISDAQINSQIEALNEDFGRTNADTTNTPVQFQGVAANTNIQFCLAVRDENGQPTTGIERRSTTVSTWSTNDNIKHFNTGGLDAWDPTQYFNIWVGNLGSFLLGYGEFPTASVSQTFGVVIHYNYFGTIGTATPPFNLGRTATHEVGHCFNLYHIWGDDGGACSGSDLVGDTPNQADENYNCPSFPHTDACAPSNPGVMFMNYMDYVNDNCMNMFTQGQSNRMNAVLTNPPYNALVSSLGCVPVVVTGTDAGVFAVTNPMNTICAGNFIPTFVLRNYGSSTLTTVTINYNVDGGTVFTHTWTGSLASLDTVTVILPPVTVVAPGAHVFNVSTSMPNGVADTDPSNDANSSSFTIVGGSGLAIPYVESFEGAFPAAGMTLNNPDNLTTWEQTNQAAKTGTQSIYMDNFDYNSNGQIDELTLPNLDLTGGAPNTTPFLSFQLAYVLYTNPLSPQPDSDTLEVLVSTDCGSTYTSVYKKFSTTLTTVVPVYTTTEFFPNSSQWRKDSINLGGYAGEDNVVVKFKHTTDYENNLFLDDINVYRATSTGIADVVNPLVSVFPNPVSDVLGIRSRDAVRIELFNTAGQKVYDSVNMLREELIRINTSEFTKGVYMLRATSANETFVTRIVRN